MATQVDIANKVLVKLRVLPEGEAAKGADLVAAKKKYIEVYNKFIEEDVANWQIDLIPDWAVIPVVAIVADQMKTNQPGDYKVQLENDAGLGWRNLIRNAAKRYSYVTTEYSSF